MKLRAVAIAAALLGTGCGRYGFFQLPKPDGQPQEVAWRWEPHSGPVLTRGPEGEWDSVDALNPSVLRWENRLLNLYSGFDGHTWRTGVAESFDGWKWRKRNVLLSPEGWEGNYIAANGHAMVWNGEILIWYQAGDPPRIGLARWDGWGNAVKHSRPVLDPGPRGSWDERGVADPYVMEAGGMLYMYYLGQDRARRQRLGVASSPDGVRWTKLRSNPVLELGGIGEFDEVGLGEPAVWRQFGYYWMLYTGRDRKEMRRLGMARSRDGVKWEKLRSPVIAGQEPWNSKVVCDATVLVEGDLVRVWYGGGDAPRPDERLNGQIGYGVLRPAGAKLAGE